MKLTFSEAKLLLRCIKAREPNKEDYRAEFRLWVEYGADGTRAFFDDYPKYASIMREHGLKPRGSR